MGEHRLCPDLPCPMVYLQVSNTMGEKSTPIQPQELALSRHFRSSLYFMKVATMPRRCLPPTGFGWTIVRSTAWSRLPSSAFSKMSAGRRPFPAMSTSRSCGTRDWVRTWQNHFGVPRCLSPNPDFIHDTACSPKTSTGPPHRGHGLPAQSAFIKGTPRCHLSSMV